MVTADTYSPLKRFVRSELFVRPADNSDYICQGSNLVLGQPRKAASAVTVSVLGAPRTGQSVSPVGCGDWRGSEH